jgi:D-xylose transport system ATP-binding protein
VIDWELLHNETKRHLDVIGLSVPFDTKMKALSAAQQQMVLIAKALSKNARILVFDEPTSSLSLNETQVLFERIRELRARGITALYISHKLDEIIAISDSTTVLRDGRFVLTKPTSELTPDGIASHMVGRQMSSMYPRTTKSVGDTALRIRGLKAFRDDVADTERSIVLRGIDLEAKRGEILGIYGLVGAGRTELLLSLFGAWPGKITYDEFTVFGEQAEPTSPEAMLARGIGLLAEDRKKSGIIPNKSLRWNVTLANLRKISVGLVLNETMERVSSERYLADLRVKAPSSETDIDHLSGGNQQKVLIGRWLFAESKILLLDDPTRGVDVGAKVEIFEILNQLAAEGAAIVFVTSELPEVLGISDRILVMHEGRIAAEFDWQQASEKKIIQYAAGNA